MNIDIPISSQKTEELVSATSSDETLSKSSYIIVYGNCLWKLGAAILQNDQPVAYASRALTENEIKWAQIEKEMASIVFASTKFHDYIFGKTVPVETDHKPLETIFKKSISKAPARLQKYDLIIVYKKEVQECTSPTHFRVLISKISFKSLITTLQGYEYRHSYFLSEN